jgi:uncharacterized membrane protein YkvA (DUF1232 family)
MALRERLGHWARTLKRDVIALWLAARDARTPMPARLLAMAVAAYALSPIDLIPDVIPILGYLDDLILIPLGIALTIRLIPASLLAELRAAAQGIADRPRSRIAAAVIVLTWLVLLVWIGTLLMPFLCSQLSRG